MTEKFFGNYHPILTHKLEEVDDVHLIATVEVLTALLEVVVFLEDAGVEEDEGEDVDVVLG